MTFRMRRVIGWALFTLFLAAAPMPARASGDWSWPVTGSRLLPYGATYATSGGATNTHGGLDIAGRQGEQVRACAAGEVVFAGKVPAGEGAQAIAVTVLTTDGLRVTYLPLASAAVSRGNRIDPGDDIGTLAGDGDASSSAAHLHLGVKRGSTRLDPEAFLASPVAASSPLAADRPAPSAHHASSAPPRTIDAPSPGTSAASYSSESAPALAAQPANVIARDVLDDGAGEVAAALERIPRLRRVRTFHESNVLAVSRMWRDITDMQSVLGRIVLAIALALVAAGCVLAAVRSAGERVGVATASPEPVRAVRGVDR